MQTPGTPYADYDNASSKALGVVLAIAGWPTLYATGDFTIPATGDISTAEGFTTIRNWLNFPTGAAAKVKGRPEEGSMSIGQMDCEILDVNATGSRELSDLSARQAYVEGVSSGTITTLNGALTAAATTVVLTDATGFANGDVCHVSQEAILLANKSGNTFTGCTRGYRLTSAVPHDTAVKVYSFKPSLYRSKAFLYKGYQGLALDSWLPAFGGIVTGEDKSPGRLAVSIKSTTWETYADRKRTLVRLSDDLREGSVVGLILTGDYTVKLIVNAAQPTGLGDGRHLFRLGEEWFAIVSSTEEAWVGSSGPTVVTATVRRGLDGSLLRDALTGLDGDTTGISFAWSSMSFAALVEGTDPITLLLQFLLSDKGDGANQATYDVLKEGIGLGIPADQVNITSFTDVQAEYDWDPNVRVFFVFPEPVESKKFLEDELLKPFGLGLMTANDGRITLVRPKHPQKFHVSRGNNSLTLNIPTGSANAKTVEMSSGVYTSAEMAAHVQTVLQRANSGFTCTYDNATFKFTIANATGFDITSPSGDPWTALGFTGSFTNTTSALASVTRGTFPTTTVSGTTYTTVTSNDIHGIQMQDNRDSQITSVKIHANYSWHRKEYRSVKTYLDAEWANLGDLPGAREYVIKSKGLLSLNIGNGRPSPFTYSQAPAVGVCDADVVDVSSSYGLDASNSWMSLFASMLFDRYKTPPDRFKCKLSWKYNVLEPGDVLQFTYDIDGVFVDRERNATTLTSRLFEVLNIKPNFRAGCCDVELMGMRYEAHS